jgi:hypothetical protein
MEACRYGALSWVGIWADIEKNCPTLATSTSGRAVARTRWLGLFFPIMMFYRPAAPSLMGTSSLYYIATALHRLPIHPVLIGSVATLSGWLRSWLTGMPCYNDLDFRRFFQPDQHPCLRIAKRAGFGWCILGGQNRRYFPGMVASMSVAGFILWFGIHRFRRTDNSFADPT